MAAKYEGIVVGTGNKVEDFGIGFYTKYGDGGVDISPIADLMKSEVYDAGLELGIINSIMVAPPTDGLWGDTRTDEDQIGATYNELEWAMTFNGDKSSLSPKQKEVLEIYNKFNTANKHKMLPIPVCIKPKKMMDKQELFEAIAEQFAVLQENNALTTKSSQAKARKAAGEIKKLITPYKKANMDAVKG